MPTLIDAIKKKGPLARGISDRAWSSIGGDKGITIIFLIVRKSWASVQMMSISGRAIDRAVVDVGISTSPAEFRILNTSSGTGMNRYGYNVGRLEGSVGLSFDIGTIQCSI